MKENLKYWLAFSKIEEIGSVFIQRLFEYTKNIKEAWNISLSELYEIDNLPRRSTQNFLEKRKKINPDECLETFEKKKINVLTFEDENFPFLLKNISNPPMVLFYKGNLANCNLEKTLAIVGSRKASEDAKKNLSRIIAEMHNTDITIVSGGALGIDTTAHESALKNNLRTIAVLGSGLEIYYPTQNKKMFEQIIEQNGVVMSEYWFSFEAMPFRFPMRNRIVTGLSKGTLVAEAAIKSGALISANLCLEQGRELMCMPGALNNPNTQGIYKLLKDGATLVTKSQDIFNALNWEIIPFQIPQKTTHAFDLSPNEQEIFEMISIDTLSADKIISKTNLNINDLMVILTTLELKGLIQQNGENYSSLVSY